MLSASPTRGRPGWPAAVAGPQGQPCSAPAPDSVSPELLGNVAIGEARGGHRPGERGAHGGEGREGSVLGEPPPVTRGAVPIRGRRAFGFLPVVSLFKCTQLCSLELWHNLYLCFMQIIFKFK